MTTEQKAAAYDKAVIKAQEIHIETESAVTAYALEEIFPGLKESCIDGLWHAQRILERTLGKVWGYQSDDGILEHKAAIAAVKEVCQKSVEWNEEDDEKIVISENHLKALRRAILKADKGSDAERDLEDLYRQLKQLKGE